MKNKKNNKKNKDVLKMNSLEKSSKNKESSQKTLMKSSGQVKASAIPPPQPPVGSPSTSNCYFCVDTVIENDVEASDINLNGGASHFKQNLLVHENCNVSRNITVTEDLFIQKKTEASKMSLTPNVSYAAGGNLVVSLNGNRVRNVAKPLPSQLISPVPGYYAPQCEFYFVSTPAFDRIVLEVGGIIPLAALSRNVYTSPNAESCIRLIDLNGKNDSHDKWGFRIPSKDPDAKVVFPGCYYWQFLKKGSYVVDAILVKRWGWNNGWGSIIRMNQFNVTPDKPLTQTVLHVGGGYSMQGTLSTIIRVDNDVVDPSTDKKSIFYLDSQYGSQNETHLGSMVWSVIYYPDLE